MNTKSNQQKFAFVIFLIIAVVALFFYRKMTLLGNSSKMENQEIVQVTKVPSQTLAPGEWVEYKNTNYPFSLMYPGDLQIRTISNHQGGYLEFIRFEETTDSLNKGLAVGIRKNTLSDEILQIKKEMADLDEGSLVKQTDIKINGDKAVKLDYAPKDQTQDEKRSIVIVTKGENAYSISTVPEQIDKVIEGFKFL